MRQTQRGTRTVQPDTSAMARWCTIVQRPGYCSGRPTPGTRGGEARRQDASASPHQPTGKSLRMGARTPPGLAGEASHGWGHRPHGQDRGVGVWAVEAVWTALFQRAPVTEGHRARWNALTTTREGVGVGGGGGLSRPTHGGAGVGGQEGQRGSNPPTKGTKTTSTKGGRNEEFLAVPERWGSNDPEGPTTTRPFAHPHQRFAYPLGMGGGGGGHFGAASGRANPPTHPPRPPPPPQYGGVWHKASVSDCLPLAAPIGLSPLLVLTLCGPERVLVVSTEPLDDLSCLTTLGSAVPETVARAVDQVHPGAHSESMLGLPTPALT